MSQVIELTGKKFGRLTVIGLAQRTEERRYLWNCLCECGEQKQIDGYSLRSGRTTSCGCWKKEATKTHGQRQSLTYNSWSTMKQRCTNPAATDYENYGGKGITIASEWNYFEEFVKDMGERPPGTTLDRVKNELGYSKENCRWATAEEQQSNKSNNVLHEFGDEMLTISEISRRTGIGISALWARYRRGKRGPQLYQK